MNLIKQDVFIRDNNKPYLSLNEVKQVYVLTEEELEILQADYDNEYAKRQSIEFLKWNNQQYFTWYRNCIFNIKSADTYLLLWSSIDTFLV